VVVQALSPLTVDTYVDRVHCRPWGLHGGLDGDGNEVGVRKKGVWQENLPNGKSVSVRLQPGDAFMLRSGGGGGFGNPHERPKQDVLNDIAEGYITPSAAARDYGIRLDDAAD
jgi:N-methylhydantoinase B